MSAKAAETEVNEDFVTVVPVGEASGAFVTVLAVGGGASGARVRVRRPRGARLGLGLKFEGGAAAAERVRRLLVQSCAPGSPAAAARAPWGELVPGDEILAIDGVPVAELTRIDCVRRLKDSDELLELLVRHDPAEVDNSTADERMPTDRTSASETRQSQSVTPTLPPPVPPRKVNKKLSFKGQILPNGNGEKANGEKSDLESLTSELPVDFPISSVTKLLRKSSFDSHLHRNSPKKRSPEEVRRLVRRLSDSRAIPPQAELYIDLLSQEWERCLLLGESESDDTSSSISTVVDRLSSIASSVENSIPSTPVMQPKVIDVQNVLNSIENIDCELLHDLSVSRLPLFEKDDSKKAFDSKNNSESKNDNGEVSVMKVLEKTVSTDNKINSTNVHVKEEPVVVHHENKKNYMASDNNNNTTLVRNITCISIESPVKTNDSDKMSGNENMLKKMSVERNDFKPQPLPRNVKLIPVKDETIVSSAEFKRSTNNTVKDKQIDEILTPTKKDCIETWLQRAMECESNGIDHKDEDFQDDAALEILPRLIDFVPKSQFKTSDIDKLQSVKPIVQSASVSESDVIRSTMDPTADARFSHAFREFNVGNRDDGSGASLDTIGEDDESAETTVTEESTEKEKADPLRSTDAVDGKLPSWDGSDNKCDIEDNKSFPEEPPRCVRQPPDGVEAPALSVERLPAPAAPPQVVPWVARRSLYTRGQDARSQGSVKDKIAMFSSHKAISTDRVDKCGTLPRNHAPRSPAATVASSPSEKRFLDRRLTKSHENLDKLPKMNYLYRITEKRPEVVGGVEAREVKCVDIGKAKEYKPDTDYATGIKRDYMTQLSYMKPNQPSKEFTRSPVINNDTPKKSHISNLDYLIEQRKKSMLKLRGLMIPDTHAPIVDLPEIRVQDPIPPTTKFSRSQPASKNTSPLSSPKVPLKTNDTWRSVMLSNNIPKYSPAFKRKSLQLYTSTTSDTNTIHSSLPEKDQNKFNFVPTIYTVRSSEGDKNRLTPSKPPRTSLENKKPIPPMVRSYSTLPAGLGLSKGYRSADNLLDGGHIVSRIYAVSEGLDSDNDSALSSTQSSYRSSASSPLNNVESVESDSSHRSLRPSEFKAYSLVKTEYGGNAMRKNETERNVVEKRTVSRTVSSETNTSYSSSAGSGATSGSQASCSSLESAIESNKVRMSRTNSIDSINRRNILASAKCRSGRDLKLNSPLIETKFSHEGAEKSPSPPLKTSERLSTLNLNVSATSNKGETRRSRAKVIDTDSDSDTEIQNQRKDDFKMLRTRKYAAANNLKLDTDKKIKHTYQTAIETNSREIGKTKNQVTEPKTRQRPEHLKDTDIKQVALKLVDNNNKTCDLPVSRVIVSETTIKKETVSVTSQSDMESSTEHSDKSLDQTTNITNAEIQAIPAPENRCNEPQVTVATVSTVSTPKVEYKPRATITVCLKKGAGAGVGLILAGGTDCEAKIITIHKILSGSPAERDGRLRKGDRVVSINGHSMDGITHAQSVSILKEPRHETLIEVETDDRNGSSTEDTLCDSESSKSTVTSRSTFAGGAPMVVQLVKSGSGAGLGLGLEGGKDSPHGDCPLTIKKLFTGGAAARSGRVQVGAVLEAVNDVPLTHMTRTQAWSLFKSLPPGPVTLLLRPAPDTP